jgi:hypothetical protein
MPSETSTGSPSTAALWSGRVMSALVILMLLFSGTMKLAKPAAITEEFARLGYSEDVILAIGIVEISCAIVYAIPQTAVLGAILATGYLGGATATHVRVGDQFIPPVVAGILIWLGLYLRDLRIRALAPWRRLP